MADLAFPPDFVWGTATSSYQVEGGWNEGGKGASIWDTFTHTPGKIANDENGDVAVDHYHRWKEDIRLMAELGLKAYRFSTSWPRILPEGCGKVNKKGLDFYDRLVDNLLAHGIEPYVCLYHWELPQALQDKGGWPERKTVDYFADYAAVLAKRLADRVEIWFTHNEPFIAATSGYFAGEHAPGIRNPLAAFKAGHHLLLSHGLAAAAIRAHAKKAVKIGITLNLNPVHAATDSKKDREAARRFDIILNRSFLDPLLKGTSPLEEIPFARRLVSQIIRPGDLEIIHTLDILGVNYYTRAVIRHDPKFPVIAASEVHPAGNEYSGMWEIYPQGIHELLLRIWNDYHPKAELMVTENGVPVPDGLDADGRVRDERRIRYIKSHLEQVRLAIKDGVPVKGYFVWSLMDNFEWALGYEQRFGLIYVDFKTQKRIVKDSGWWYTRVIRGEGGL